MKTNWFKNIFRKKDKEKESYVKIPEDIRLKIIEKSSERQQGHRIYSRSG